jgi:serine/threonine-protein kinase HipA
MSEIMKKNQLSIRLYGEPVGILEQTKTGKMEFTYLSTAAMALSFSMPIRDEVYTHIACESFFGGLLPESEAVKKIIGKRYGVSPNNNFSLLRAIGDDCAGAISCHEIDVPILSSHVSILRLSMILFVPESIRI